MKLKLGMYEPAMETTNENVRCDPLQYQLYVSCRDRLYTEEEQAQ